MSFFHWFAEFLSLLREWGEAEREIEWWAQFETAVIKVRTVQHSVINTHWKPCKFSDINNRTTRLYYSLGFVWGLVVSGLSMWLMNSAHWVLLTFLITPGLQEASPLFCPWCCLAISLCQRSFETAAPPQEIQSPQDFSRNTEDFRNSGEESLV